MTIKRASFAGPNVANHVTIEIWVDHDGVARRGVVACDANTQTYELTQFTNVKDNRAGEELIKYLRAAASEPGGKVRFAIDDARSLGW